ncbi:alkaline phosphatase D family protein [Dokdonella immobilis]|uniref:Alkaline phosphatase D n=1 Tax=Dokdonella immobilis TaxID=578942 RepID=A0A1I5AGG8_9GAMM|nr:alkaline phosphatase D family protein [Dokdonella immobilis]SFN61309.1 alkaline phosphatase D [Dokdonella immobilis]
MPNITRRQFLAVAAAIGAELAWSRQAPAASKVTWHERRDLYAEGVASAEPDSDSVILWTRRPFANAERGRLTVEVAEDAAFTRVLSQRAVTVLAESDWTCRVLAAGLAPATEYWYRFTDDEGNGSRIGRTLTAPRERDGRPVRFAFVSCQSVNEGAQNAYRRMIHEDEKAPRSAQLGFVLHLGDFIYEVVEYPDEIKTRYDRTIYDIGRIPDSRKVLDFHVPTTLEGYRHVYRAYLRDPDIQDARARFPFVCMWDNHEFSWLGWQGHIRYPGEAEPAQALKVAANQAWFEYIPARIKKASGPGLDRFDAPKVVNAPIETYDENGLGVEPNNLKAIESLIAYRAYRYGRHVELVITDRFSFRMRDPTDRPEASTLGSADFLGMFPEEAMRIIDGGRAYADGKPPQNLSDGIVSIPNFRKDEAPVTILGKTQKAWFKKTLAHSRATWKIWAATGGTLDWRADPQNLPEGLGKPWPVSGYAGFGGDDFGTAYHERAELYDFVRDQRITGFAVVSGDRHSFWAGYAAKALPPRDFEPVGIAFVTGSISAPGMVEAQEHKLRKDHPLRPLFLAEAPGQQRTQATVNLTLHRGVRSALEYAKSGDLAAAKALTNPDLSPHLEFIDMGGHGYSVVSASAEAMQTEFVCIPRPIRRSTSPDGGELRYRVVHTANLWKSGEKPRLEQKVLEGDAELST